MKVVSRIHHGGSPRWLHPKTGRTTPWVVSLHQRVLLVRISDLSDRLVLVTADGTAAASGPVGEGRC